MLYTPTILILYTFHYQKSNFSSNLHKISFIILLYILTDHEPVWIFYPMCGFLVFISLFL